MAWIFLYQALHFHFISNKLRKTTSNSGSEKAPSSGFSSEPAFAAGRRAYKWDDLTP